MRGSNRIAEDMRLENAGSRMLQEAADVLARFLRGEDGREGILGNGREGIMGAKGRSGAVVHAYHAGLLG